MPPREALPEAVAVRYGGSSRAGCSAVTTLITTNHILYEDDVRTILGLPDDVFTFALMPIGYPIGKYGPLARRPVAEVICRNWEEKWD